MKWSTVLETGSIGIRTGLVHDGAVDLGLYGIDFSGSLFLANNIVRTSRAASRVDCEVDGTGGMSFSDNLLHADNDAGISGSCDVSPPA